MGGGPEVARIRQRVSGTGIAASLDPGFAFGLLRHPEDAASG
jgi:hypothetical protein